MNFTHISEVELQVVSGICPLERGGPGLAAVDAGGRGVHLLAAHGRGEGGLEDVLAVHFLQLHILPVNNRVIH